MPPERHLELLLAILGSSRLFFAHRVFFHGLWGEVAETWMSSAILWGSSKAGMKHEWTLKSWLNGRCFHEMCWKERSIYTFQCGEFQKIHGMCSWSHPERTSQNHQLWATAKGTFLEDGRHQTIWGSGAFGQILPLTSLDHQSNRFQKGNWQLVTPIGAAMCWTAKKVTRLILKGFSNPDNPAPTSTLMGDNRMQECQNLGSCKHLLKFNTYSDVWSIVENTRLKWINEIGWKDLESVCDWANRISMQMNLFSHFQAISARVVLPMLPPPPKDLKPPTHTFLQWEPPS